MCCFRRSGTYGPTSSSALRGNAGSIRRCRTAVQVDKGIQHRLDYSAAFDDVSDNILSVVVDSLIYNNILYSVLCSIYPDIRISLVVVCLRYNTRYNFVISAQISNY